MFLYVGAGIEPTLQFIASPIHEKESGFGSPLPRGVVIMGKIFVRAEVLAARPTAATRERLEALCRPKRWSVSRRNPFGECRCTKLK